MPNQSPRRRLAQNMHNTLAIGVAPTPLAASYCKIRHSASPELPRLCVQPEKKAQSSAMLLGQTVGTAECCTATHISIASAEWRKHESRFCKLRSCIVQTGDLARRMAHRREAHQQDMCGLSLLTLFSATFPVLDIDTFILHLR